MELFEYIKTFYENPDKVSNLTDFEKRKHFFMFNRRMSIGFPLQANYFNFNGIDGAVATQIWIEFIKKTNPSKTVPSCNYVKINKKSKDKKWYPKDQSEFKKYRNFYELSIRDFNENLEFDEAQTKKHYETFIQQLQD